MYVRVYVCMCMFVYVCVCVYVYIYMCVCMYVCLYPNLEQNKVGTKLSSEINENNPMLLKVRCIVCVNMYAHKYLVKYRRHTACGKLKVGCHDII
jgi:hypothetical protein